MDLNRFIINCNATIQATLAAIDLNKNGYIIIVDDQNKILGVATDGDIRRGILSDISLNESIMKCMNKNYIKAYSNTPRELLLKHLDQNIKFIPILDKENRVISIVSKDFLPEIVQKKVFSRAKSPVRISFGGGGSDVSSYFLKNSAAVINATISLYSHSTLKIREDHKIVIISFDLNDSIEFKSLEELINYEGKFSLIKYVIKAINPSFGFELFIHSDYPMNSGLGGSAVVASSILGCFNQFRNDKWSKHDIAEIAYQSERLHLGIAGGWQDQYATVFGGFNFMEFNYEQNIINPIRVDNEVLLELEESLLLCYTGFTHDSGEIHRHQIEQSKIQKVKKQLKSNVDLTFEIRNHLLRGRLNDFGKCLHKAWEFKKGYSTKISTPWIDNFYDGAMQNGAIGGKLLGAGGGGYFLFFVPAFDRIKLMNWLKEMGLSCTPFVFENHGLESWKVRED